MVYHQPYLSTMVLAGPGEGKKSEDVSLGVSFQGGMEGAEKNFIPGKGGFAAELEMSLWRGWS